MKRFHARQAYLSFIFILSIFFITGCGGGGETGHWLPGQSEPDTTAPTVTATVNANGATGVAINTKVGATFSEAMDPLTITTTTFTLRQGATAVPGAVTYSGVSAVFTPATNLAANTTYTATISTGAQDLAGNQLAGNQAPWPAASNYVWSWTTGAVADTTAPMVTHTVNANGATGVATNTKIAATFSEAMDPSTITAATFTFKQGATAVPGTVTYSGVTAVFTPATILAANTTYTATITTGAQDLAGNQLAGNQAPWPAASNYVWSWTTDAVADNTAPTVTFTVPANAATGVLTNTKISATFSEAMDPLTITTTTFTLRQGTSTWSGTVAYSGVTAVFTPPTNLAANTTYTATITTGAKDLAGNALASNYVWSFTTGATADTIAPTVTFTVPAHTATGVSLNIKPTATFSEAMDPLTITNLTFTLYLGGTAIPGAVTYSGVTAVFTPTTPLWNTTYVATITTGAKDLAGNALEGDYVWNFDVGEAQDNIAPMVILTVPVHTATGVSLNTKPTATFSEAMDPLTITNLTFILKIGSTAVLGAVTYSGVTAVFTPTTPLVTTTYTATITTGAKDLAGNALASDYVWNFTVGADHDTIAPTVTITAPVHTATGVSLNAKPTATFSEAMDPLTITNLTFTLKHGATAVIGTVTYSGVTAVFTPTTPAVLAANTTYTATITTGAKDLAGNALEPGLVPNPWTFTTSAAAPPPHLGPPPVILGAAGTFRVLAGSAVTNTDIVGNRTSINGNVGVSPGSTVNALTELNNIVAPFHIYAGGPIALAAKIDLLVAYNDAQSRSTAAISLPGQIGGLTLAPGLYVNSSSSGISGAGPNGILTLDGQGDPTAVWIFKMGSTLITDPGTSIVCNNGCNAENIFWQVGSSATLGVNSIFYGTILSDAALTMNTGATLHGRALTRSAAVTLDTNHLVP